jgi:hypothetical protein
MSRQEAALALGGLHTATVSKLCRAGRLRRVFIGRRSMVTVASVQALATGAGQDVKQTRTPRLVGDDAGAAETAP